MVLDLTPHKIRATYPHRTFLRATRAAATDLPPVKFVLALGNNFFPEGVESVDDEAFTRCWRDVFINAEVRAAFA